MASSNVSFRSVTRTVVEEVPTATLVLEGKEEINLVRALVGLRGTDGSNLGGKYLAARKRLTKALAAVAPISDEIRELREDVRAAIEL